MITIKRCRTSSRSTATAGCRRPSPKGTQAVDHRVMPFRRGRFDHGFVAQHPLLPRALMLQLACTPSTATGRVAAPTQPVMVGSVSSNDAWSAPGATASCACGSPGFPPGPSVAPAGCLSVPPGDSTRSDRFRRPAINVSDSVCSAFTRRLTFCQREDSIIRLLRMPYRAVVLLTRLLQARSMSLCRRC